VAYSERRIEDWDFRGCYEGSPTYDVEADLFLSTHYTTVVAVDLYRLSIIKSLIEAGVAEIDNTGDYAYLTIDHADDFLRGMRRADSRLTQQGRFGRKVTEALRRELRKYGRLRSTLLPLRPTS